MKGLVSSVIVAVTMTSIFLGGLANAGSDVKSGGKWTKSYPEVIHVIHNPDQTISFIYCDGDKINQCRNLGSKERYSLRDLQRKEMLLKKDRKAMIVSDTTYVVGSALVGAIAALAAPTPAGATVISIYAGSGAAAATLYILKSFMDPGKDGARAKFRAPRTLSEHILNGDEVQVNMPIEDFAQQLDGVLKDIF